MQKVLTIITFFTLFFSVTGCSSFKFPWAYTISIRQGNIVDKEKVEQLEKGMSKKQVRFILGTPLIEDTFNPDRWDYYFAIRKEEKNLYNYRLTLYFEEDALDKWDGTLDALKSEKEELKEGEKEVQIEEEKKKPELI